MQGQAHSGNRWLARLLYLGGLGLVVLLSAWALWPTELPPPAPTPPAPQPVVEPVAPVPVPRAVERAAPEAGPPAPPSSAAPAPEDAPLVRPSTPRPPKQVVDPQAQARTAALLAQARAELPQDPAAALKTLLALRHSQPAPLGEAELLRLEALIRLGKEQEAGALSRRLAASPTLKREVERVLRDTHPD